LPPTVPQEEDFDVIVVGSGGAGLRAALAAHETGARVLVLTKGPLETSGTTATACSDRMAFHATLPHTAPGGPDAWRYHAEDIYRLGGYVSDADLARVLAQGAAEAVEYLLRLGVPFVKDAEGRLDQFLTDGSRYARACYTGPHTANHIHEALRREVRRLGVPVLEGVMATDLALDAAGHVAGVRLADGRLLPAKAVVLATGGAGEAYEVHVFPEGMTGDGYAMAYRAGAELVNMEFIQFGLSSVTTRLACSGSLMRALPRLVTDQDREFLPRYFPPGTPPNQIYAVLFRKGASWPVSYEEPSHVIDVAVFSEIARGRTVWLDFSRNPEGLDLGALDPALWAEYPAFRSLRLTEPPLCDSPLARLAAINRPSIEWLAQRGIRLEAEERIQIAPACQHFQGGVKINTRAATTVPGLFACGEVAGGQHGANRPGGNALLDGQVMGRIAGREAAAWARTAPPGPPVEASRPAERPASPGRPPKDGTARAGAVDIGEVRSTLRRLMTHRASIKRWAEGIREALEELADLTARPWTADGADPVFRAETENIALVAEMVLRAAGARTESRGPHLWFASAEALRPLPRRDPEGRRYTVIRRGPDGRMHLEPRRPVPPDWPRVEAEED